MPAPGGALTALAPQRAAPAERDALVARTPPERQKLFWLVRRILDDLEEAAPWDDLYYPPEAPDALLGILAALLGVVDGIPDRLRELIAALSLLADDDETRATLEEADFYYAGIHGMCAHDLGRLRSLLDPYSAPDAPPPPASERNFLCEVAADLKGKYGSALMGATASILAAGLWSGVEVEPLLFPEKADEPKRNEALVEGLKRTIAAIAELPSQVRFAELMQRWRLGARVDPYALADLATFRGLLGQLLKRSVRRALYSGDYHQIQKREKALAGRIAILEAVHDTTWSNPPEGAEAAGEVYGRLVGLTLEIAAILDVDLLEDLAGPKAVKDLRVAATVERTAAEEGGTSRRKPLSPEIEPLVPLLGQEDLQTFLELLLGSVMKRASFAAHRTTAAAAPAFDGDDTGELLPRLDLLGGDEVSIHQVRPPDELRPTAAAPAEAAQRQTPAAPSPAAGPAVAKPPVAKPEAPRPAVAKPAPAPRAPAAPPPPPVSAERRREVLGGLNEMLTNLQSPANAHYAAFRMLQRLVGRHARLPAAMVQGAHPFFFEVLNELVPQLEAAAAIGAVPTEARGKLMECCLVLTDQALTPERMAEQVPANLARLQRLLEGLTAATAAQLRASGG